MVFAYVLLPEAQDEYDASVFWYLERSIETAESFANEIDETIKMLCINPYRGRNSYLNFYEIIVERFPFSIVYFIDKEENKIIVASIFHHKRNPGKKFKG